MYGKENCQGIFGSKPIEMRPYSHMFGAQKGAVTFCTSKIFQEGVYCSRNSYFGIKLGGEIFGLSYDPCRNKPFSEELPVGHDWPSFG
jgi:hypothetical protein